MPDPKNFDSHLIIKNDASVGKEKNRKSDYVDSGKRPSSARRNDPYIFGIYALLLIVSVVELFSASSSEVTAGNVYGPLLRHGIFLALGLVIVLVFANTHYIVFRKLAPYFAVISLILLMAATFMGVEINGAQRAIKIGSFTIQPPEIVKLTVVVLLADILAKNLVTGDVSRKGIVWAAIVVLVFGGMLYPNGLTNMILLMGASLCMFVLSGMKKKNIITVFAIYIVCGITLIGIKSLSNNDDEFDKIGNATAQTEFLQTASAEENTPNIGRLQTQINRVKRHIRGVHPQDTIDDLNRQVIFAKFAQAHGGIIGHGPGNSRESARLPLAFSDYIYSIIVEDTGLIGGLALLLLYLCLILRAGRLASKCSKPFPALLIMGCAILIVFQALVHMAIVTGFFPVSGQPLPLISKGGTSVLVMSAAIGMMLSVSKFDNGDKKSQKKYQIHDSSEELETVNPMQISR